MNWIVKQLKSIRRAISRGLSQLLSPVKEFVQEFVIGRWKYFYKVRRFTFGWLAFVGLLVIGGTAQTAMLVNDAEVTYPVDGGRLREGVVGELSNFNPLYADTAPNLAAARLMYSSLVQYDEKGRLKGDLATKWSSNEEADVFTVSLRDDAKWHDGEPLTAEDVAFTIKLMQNKAVAAPELQATWEEVTVELTGQHELKLELPNSLAAFPPLLRFMVLPQHVLGGTEPDAIRASAFNQQPVGSGPFEFRSFDADEGRLSMLANDEYYRGEPRIDSYELLAFESESELPLAIEDGLIDFYGTEQPVLDDEYELVEARLGRTRYLFFNTRRDVLEKPNIRQALTRAVDPEQFTGDGSTVAAQGLLLADQLKLGNKYRQLAYDQEKSAKQLTDIGWRLRGDDAQVRTNKSGDQLQLRLVYLDQSDEQSQARLVRDQLAPLGVAVELTGLARDEFDQAVFNERDFDMVLAKVNSGVDPDVFVYWHSSQAGEGGLNISGVDDAQLDRALASGRTRRDGELREAKYLTAAEEWRSLAPAVSLTQDSYYFVSRQRVNAYDGQLLPSLNDRYFNAHEWTAQEERRLP